MQQRADTGLRVAAGVWVGLMALLAVTQSLILALAVLAGAGTALIVHAARR